MKEGTKSILFGCHSVVHSFLVLLSWKKIYGSWPQGWQVVCIFLHDIGHFGRDYLTHEEEKKKHWRFGAMVGYRLYGKKAVRFLAGHCDYSGYSFSKLYKADKYSWHIAPRIWLFTNTLAEPKLAMGYGRWEAVDRFKEQVRKSVESGQFKSTHSMYLERCKEAQVK